MLVSVFFLFGIILIASALYAVSTENIIRSVFALFACFFSITGILVFAQSDFIAISQLMIYVGGILVVMVFGIMLSQKNGLDPMSIQRKDKKTLSLHQVMALIVCVFIFVLLTTLFFKYQKDLALPPVGSDVQLIGIQLITKYLLAFELISVLLLAVLIFAATITRKEKEAVHEN